MIWVDEGIVVGWVFREIRVPSEVIMDGSKVEMLHYKLHSLLRALEVLVTKIWCWEKRQ